MKKQRSPKLEKLVDTKCLKSYEFENVDEEGIVNRKSSNRNTERLTLVFPNGEKLVIDTFCSGSLENTSIIAS